MAFRGHILSIFRRLLRRFLVERRRLGLQPEPATVAQASVLCLGTSASRSGLPAGSCATRIHRPRPLLLDGGLSQSTVPC